MERIIDHRKYNRLVGLLTGLTKIPPVFISAQPPAPSKCSTKTMYYLYYRLWVRAGTFYSFIHLCGQASHLTSLRLHFFICRMGWYKYQHHRVIMAHERHSEILDEVVESLHVVPNTVPHGNGYCDKNFLIIAIHNVKMIILPPPHPWGSVRINETISRTEIVKIKVLYKSKRLLLMIIIIIINLVLEKS